jgi:thiamine phosphate synthase YjbQ (UPF0047 family)
MKSHTVHLTMNVPARMDFVNITSEVEKAVLASGVREGLCLVNAMHITASVFISDDEPGLHEDYKRWLAITDGKLDFGPWEQIFYGEFDGRRSKRVLVKVIGE